MMDKQHINAGYESEFKTNLRKKDDIFVVESNGTVNGSLANGGTEKLAPGSRRQAEVSWRPGGKGDPHLCFRLGKQAAMVGTWMCMGMFLEIIGPTLPELNERLGVNYEEMSRALIGKYVGMLAGSIIGGLLNQKFYKKTEYLIGTGLLVAALATIAIPYSNSLPLAAFFFSLLGIAEGVINTGGNIIVMHLWKENAASPMQSLHFGFGLGALLAPQVARPFLSADSNDGVSNTSLSLMLTTGNATYMTPRPLLNTSRIEIAYIIAGSLIMAFSLVIFAFGIKGNPPGVIDRQPQTNLRKMFHPGSCARGRTRYSMELFVCLFLFFLQAVGGDRAYGTFLFSFAIESKLKFTKSQASTLQTMYWACHTGGRFLGVIFGLVVPVHYMMGADSIGAFVSSTTLAFLADTQPLALWIGSGFLGSLIGICVPNGMAWANLHLNMNSMGVMVCMVGGSVGGFIYQYVSGSLFQMNPQNLMWVMVAYSISLGVVFVAMQIIVSVRKMAIHPADENELDDGTIIVTPKNEKVS